MIGPADVVKAAANLQSHATSNVANVSQRAALAALTGPHGAGVRDAVRRSPTAVTSCIEMLDSIEGVTCVEPGGAFYCFPDFRGLLGAEIAGTEDRIEHGSLRGPPRRSRGGCRPR